MKRLIYFFLNRMFGKKRYYRFFLVLKNIGFQGLNYRNTNIENNGELFLIKAAADHYKTSTEKIILFDVGANVGNYSRLLATHFQNTATIHAFEPFSFPFAHLQQLQKNYPSVQAHPFGLSDKTENLVIHSSDEFSEIGGIYNRNLIFQDIPHDKQELCHFTTLDSFCKEQNLERIHFLKIDVEGHELAVLKGAAQLLEKGSIQMIQFEFGAGNHFSRTYFMDFYTLLHSNYALYRLLEDGLVAIPAYNSEQDMQVLANFVAIHKSVPPGFIPTIHVL